MKGMVKFSMKRLLIFVLLLALTSCKGYNTHVEGAYEFTDKGGQKHRFEIKFIFEGMEKGDTGGESREVIGEAIKAKGKESEVAFDVKFPEDSSLIEVDGKKYSIKKSDDLKALYKYVLEKIKNAKEKKGVVKS